jgi:hypothetical protein
MRDPKRRNAGEEWLHAWERRTWTAAHPGRRRIAVTRDEHGTLCTREDAAPAAEPRSGDPTE